MGGGGGHSAVIKALKDLNIELSTIVNMVDDGGHSGKLMRDEGVHSPGDARRVLSASSKHAQKFLGHRSADGSAYGNLLLAAAEKETGSFQGAINKLRGQMQIIYQVFPATEDKIILHAETVNHNTITGQAEIVKNIRSRPDQPYERVWIEPKNASLSAGAANALNNADYAVLTMGDLYSSIAPLLCLQEIFSHPKKDAKIIWLPNFAVTPGHIHYKTTSGALKFLQSLNPSFRPNVIVVHERPLPLEQEDKLRERGYTTSKVDSENLSGIEIQTADLINPTYTAHNEPGDRIDRSPIAYDPDKLRSVFKKIII